MKLKTVTAIALFIFVAFFAGLLVLPQNFLDSLTQSSQTQNTAVGDINPITGVVGTLLTVEEIAKHNIETDCYLIVNNIVHDVTTFINKHPGGRQRILEMCGGEASKIFSTIHSNFAWNLLKNYQIGSVGSHLDTVKASSIKNNPSLDAITNNLEREDEDEVEYEKD